MKKIAIATVQVPFITGGAEVHAALLKKELIKRKFNADIISIPFKWHPHKALNQQLEIAQKIDLSEVPGQKIDQVISLKFPMYYCQHPKKVGWILHQHRQAYDLYQTQYSDLADSFKGRRLRQKIKKLDEHYLPKHQKLYTNAKNVANRLWTYNKIKAQHLYHPPQDFKRFHSSAYENYLLIPGRVEEIKRQHLIIDALAISRSKFKLIFIGNINTQYANKLIEKVKELNLEQRIEFKGFVSQEEKIQLYANASAIYNGALDEDYGYTTLEAFYAKKMVITHTDSGGALEFVQHQLTGYITPPKVQDLAQCIERLSGNLSELKQLGENAYQLITEMNLDWDNIIEQLILD